VGRQTVPRNYGNRLRARPRRGSRGSKEGGIWTRSVSTRTPSGWRASTAFIQNEALANEESLPASTLREASRTIAHAYLRNARYCYLRWGRANGKMWGSSNARFRSSASNRRAQGHTTTTAAPVDQMDLAAVVDHLAGGVRRDRPRPADPPAADGGGRACGEPREASSSFHAATSSASRRKPRRTAPASRCSCQKASADVRRTFPESVLRYVLRTQQSVILDDASADDLFSGDDTSAGTARAPSSACHS